MTNKNNKQLVEDYLSAWAVADESRLSAVLDDRFRYSNPPPGLTPDKKGQIAFSRVYRAAFPDLKIKIQQVLTDGDHVVARFVASGTHKGEFMGIAPSGNRVEAGGITIAKIQNGKIVEDITEYDALGILTSVGAVPNLAPLHA